MGYRFLMVGMAGFEPAAPRPPDECATRLRYIPIKGTIHNLKMFFKIILSFLKKKC